MLWIMCVAFFILVLIIVDTWNKLIIREGFKKDYCKDRYNCFWRGGYR